LNRFLEDRTKSGHNFEETKLAEKYAVYAPIGFWEDGFDFMKFSVLGTSFFTCFYTKAVHVDESSNGSGFFRER
jgi:hypothetical protein